ncbi:MAG TPA: hypothetical protein VFL94_05140 [Actinomycetales bacterium]|nr:hypothetical protein [Actinomycetales bacterium]
MPPYGAGPGWTPPPKPGVVPLRPLGLGDLLDGAVQTMRQNPRVMLGLSAALMAISAVLSSVFIVVGLPRVAAGFQGTDDRLQADEIASVVGGGVMGFLLPFVVQTLMTIVLTGILIVAVSQAVLGRKPSAGEVWRRARPRLLALVGLSLMSALVVLLAVLVPVVPGILLLAARIDVGGGLALALGVVAAIVLSVLVYVRLAFAAPALLLEQLGVGGALRRSWRLVTGSWWRAFGILLLGAIIAGAINGLVQLPFSLIGNLGGTLAGGDGESLGDVTTGMQIALVVSNIGSVLASTVTAPFTAALTALLYIDLRIRREGLDVALARAAAER